MPGERGLHASSVKHFALDGGVIDDLLRYEFDGQAIACVGIEVMQRADDDAGAFKKLLFSHADAICVEAKVRPVGKLSVPAHDR